MNDIKHDIKKRHKNLSEFRYIAVGFFLTILSGAIMPVSYTHLDVYKRQDRVVVVLTKPADYIKKPMPRVITSVYKKRFPRFYEAFSNRHIMYLSLIHI